MKLSLIVAVSENGVIGKQNTIPWHLPDDMKFFKEKTAGSAIISGRKNYESIPKKFRPLPGRFNIVVTRQNNYVVEDGVFVAEDIEAAIDAARSHENVFIIGGGEIYAQSLNFLISEIWLTRVHAQIDGDITFPELDATKWKIEEEVFHPADEKHIHSFTFFKYVRV